MADKVVPGSDTTRGDVPVHRMPGGHPGADEIDPNSLRDSQGFGIPGVNSTPKPPRTDPSTYGDSPAG